MKEYETYKELSEELVDKLIGMYPDVTIVYDRWSGIDEVEVLREHLTTEYDFRGPDVDQNDLCDIGIGYKYYGVSNTYIVAPGSSEMEFISCTRRVAYKLAKEYISDMTEQGLLDLKLYFDFDCIVLDRLSEDILGYTTDDKEELKSELYQFTNEEALDIIKEHLTTDWLDKLTSGILDIDGYGFLSSYDNVDNEEYYNGVFYDIFRIN